MGRVLVNKTSAIDDSRGLVNKYTDDGRALVNKPSRGIVNKPTRGIVNKDSILNNQNVRVKKRISVIPFDGEENFIVPKRGGFGQPDNENFVMVAGANVPAPDLPNDAPNTGQNGMGVPIGQPQQPILTSENTPNIPRVPIEPTPTTPAPATPQQLCVAPNMWVNGQCLQGGVEQSSAELDCINSGGLYQNGVCITSTSPKPVPTTTVPPTSTTTEPPKTTIADAPVVETLPTFPVWSSLDCTTLRDKIAEYNAILSTSRFGATIVEAYNTEIAKAQAIYNTKCNVTTPAPTTSTTTITPLIPIGSIGGGGGGGVFGGRGGGGGGGGLGEPPTDVAPVEEKSYLGLYLILGGLALLYFLTRKKKQ